MTRLKGSKKNTKKKGRTELVRNMLDYMAEDFQDMMRAKKRKEVFSAFLGAWMPRLKDVVKRKGTTGKRRKITIHPAMESRRGRLLTKQIKQKEVYSMKAEWQIRVLYMFFSQF